MLGEALSGTLSFGGKISNESKRPLKGEWQESKKLTNRLENLLQGESGHISQPQPWCVVQIQKRRLAALSLNQPTASCAVGFLPRSRWSGLLTKTHPAWLDWWGQGPGVALAPGGVDTGPSGGQEHSMASRCSGRFPRLVLSPDLLRASSSQKP